MSFVELVTKLLASKGQPSVVNDYLEMIYNLPDYKVYFPRGFNDKILFTVGDEVFVSAEKCALYSNNMILFASSASHVVVGRQCSLFNDYRLVLIPAAFNHYLFKNMTIHIPVIIESNSSASGIGSHILSLVEPKLLPTTNVSVSFVDQSHIPQNTSEVKLSPTTEAHSSDTAIDSTVQFFFFTKNEFSFQANVLNIQSPIAAIQNVSFFLASFQLVAFIFDLFYLG